MHPAVIHWWRKEQAAQSACLPLGCGADAAIGAWEARRPTSGFVVGLVGSVGVRRPLRFLAYKLQLRDEQVAKLAVILDELKTERAQAAVDDRRTVTSFAAAIEEETFDETRAREAE